MIFILAILIINLYIIWFTFFATAFIALLSLYYFHLLSNEENVWDTWELSSLGRICWRANFCTKLASRTPSWYLWELFKICNWHNIKRNIRTIYRYVYSRLIIWGCFAIRRTQLLVGRIWLDIWGHVVMGAIWQSHKLHELGTWTAR